MTTGERIQQARKAAKMSQKELGDKLGVSASMIGQYENNLRNPKYDRILTIAQILNVSPSDLVDDLTAVLFAPAPPAITITTEDGDFINVPRDSHEGKLLNSFQHLNEDGKLTAIERVEELLQIPKYQRPGTYYFYDESGELKKVMRKISDEE